MAIPVRVASEATLIDRPPIRPFPELLDAVADEARLTLLEVAVLEKLA